MTELPENFHPHSRYVLKDKTWGFNSADIIHGTPDGPVFDLGVDLDDKFGVAFIRVSDVEEMARVLGMVTREEAQALKQRIEELNAEVKNVPNEVESLKDGLSSLVADFLDRVVPRNDSVPSSEAIEIAQGQSELPFDDDNPAGGESSGTSGQDDKPVVGKRPAKLSSGSGDEFGFGDIDRK